MGTLVIVGLVFGLCVLGIVGFLASQIKPALFEAVAEQEAEIRARNRDGCV